MLEYIPKDLANREEAYPCGDLNCSGDITHEIVRDEWSCNVCGNAPAKMTALLLYNQTSKEKAMSHKYHEEGDECPTNILGLAWDCQGTLQIVKPFDGGCSCHTGNPPCSYCTTTTLECDECCWSETTTY